jgi:rod shape-determining protein MreB
VIKFKFLEILKTLKVGFGKDIAIDWGSRYCYTWSKQTGFEAFLSTVWLDDKDHIKAWGNANQASLAKYKPQPLIKNGYLTDFKLSIEYIKLLLNSILERFELIKPTIWIAINTQTHSSEVEGLDFVLTQAGVGKIHFVNQNLALAIHYNFDFKQTKTQTMLHFGQQQTLISTISSGGFIQEKVLNFGAQAIDTIIEDYIRNVYRLSVSIYDIENLKSLLAPGKFRTQIWGKDLLSDRIKSVDLEYNEIWNQTKSQIDNLTDLVKDYIMLLPDEIVNDLVDNGILVSGGGAMFGKICEYLQIKLNLNLFIDPDPRTTIISGMQKIIENKDDYLNSTYVPITKLNNRNMS